MKNSIWHSLIPMAVGVGASLFLVAATAHAAPMGVTSLADFNSAISGATTSTDPFDNDIAGNVMITFDTNVVSTVSDGNLSNVANEHRVLGGKFEGRVDGTDGIDAPRLLTWVFPFPVIGFGADFADLFGIDVAIAGSGTFFDIETQVGGRSGFFGIVDAMTPFTQVQFTMQGTTNSNSFDADNLIYAAAVPEPGTLALFGLGLAGLGFARRKRMV